MTKTKNTNQKPGICCRAKIKAGIWALVAIVLGLTTYNISAILHGNADTLRAGDFRAGNPEMPSLCFDRKKKDESQKNTVYIYEGVGYCIIDEDGKEVRTNNVEDYALALQANMYFTSYASAENTAMAFTTIGIMLTFMSAAMAITYLFRGRE